MAAALSPPGPVLISWSSLKRWEHCPQHQLRVIKHETEKSNKGRIFLPGTVCDLVMRRWLDSDDPQPGEMDQFVEIVFNETVNAAESRIPWKGDPRQDMENVKAMCREAVNRLEPWLVQNVLPYEYAPEHKFKAHLTLPYLTEGVQAPVMMRGGIDILVRDDRGKFRLYDLKITKDPSYLHSTLAQLTFYDLAWGVIQGDFEASCEWGFVAPMIPEFIVPVTVSQDDRRVMLSRIIKYAQGQWMDNWTPKPDDAGCQWCEARAYCEKFRDIAIVDENGKQKMSFMASAEQRKKFRTPEIPDL
jgi:hypothetical protein